MEMKSHQRFMLGNLVLYRKNEVCRVMSIADDVMCLKKTSDGYMLYARYAEIESIPLSDKFFLGNDYVMTQPQKDGYGRVSINIVPMDGFGPAITKHMNEDGFAPYTTDYIEYCITGIIIRTIDEFQNIMNICGCQNIADKVEVRL